MLRSSVIAVALLGFMAGPSAAQLEKVNRVALMPSMARDVRVTVSMNFFVPAPMSDKDAAVKAQEDARAVLYQSASRECEILRASIASDCRLESINVSINRNYGQHQPDGFNANGNFSYRITSK
jgi:hypothetical protein